eukprot:GSMAST32.ASY1.ANO1.1335.1 assembled CDS
MPTNEPVFSLHLVFLVLGVWITFLFFGKAQESLTRTEFGVYGERFRFMTFLIVAQSVGNSFIAAIILLSRYGRKVQFGAGVKTSEWFIVALGYLGAHKFGLWSLLYIPFPLQVLVKSCKTVPVMFGEVLLGKAKLSLKKVVGVVLVTVGIAVFMLFKSSTKKVKGQATFDYFSADMAKGCLLILGALFCDGLYGPYQNKIVVDATNAKPNDEYIIPSAHHLMFNMNFWQGIFGFILLSIQYLGTGKHEIFEVKEFMIRNPDCISPLIVFVCTMALGNLFIYQLQRDYGALVVTLTTTIRKLFSVLLSSLPVEGICHVAPVPLCTYISGFGNSINSIQWVGVGVVFGSKFAAGPIASILSSVFCSKSKQKTS